MKSLAVPSLVAFLVLGSASGAVAQLANVASPPSGAYYSYNALHATYVAVPVDVTLYLSNSIYSPNVMYLYMYQGTPTGPLLVPANVFAQQGVAISRTEVQNEAPGTYRYRFQGTVHVSNGSSNNYFFQFSFFDSLAQQFVPDPSTGEPFTAVSGAFGSGVYITNGLGFVPSGSVVSKPVTANTRRRGTVRRGVARPR
ncbi:hypothetical protein ACYOEI_13450 [Singulisphaera rosea]